MVLSSSDSEQLLQQLHKNKTLQLFVRVWTSEDIHVHWIHHKTLRHFSPVYYNSATVSIVLGAQSTSFLVYTDLFENLNVIRSYDMGRLLTKPTKWHVRPAQSQISLGIRPVWSDSLLSAWRNIGSSTTHWPHCKDSDQTGRMPRLIWVFAGCTDHFVGFVMRRLIWAPFLFEIMYM